MSKTFADIGLAYNQAIIDGTHLPHSNWVILQAKRWQAMLDRPDIFYDGPFVDSHCLEVATKMQVWKGPQAGKQFVYQPFQVWILAQLLGTRRKATGLRVFQYLFWIGGKGGAKSPFAATMALMGVSSDLYPEPGMIGMAAYDSEQAEIVGRDVVRMWEDSKGKFPNVERWGRLKAKEVINKDGARRTYCLTKEGRSKLGGETLGMAIVDEISGVVDQELLDQIDRGLKVTEPLTIMTSNAGASKNTPAYEMYERSQNILNGTVRDDTWLPVICMVDDGDRPFWTMNDDGGEIPPDRPCWYKSNPMMDVVTPPNYYENAVNQVRLTPKKRIETLRLYFGVWTEAAEVFLTKAEYDECVDADMKLEDFAGSPCWIGIDLAKINDLCSYCILFDDGRTDGGRRKYAAFTRSFTRRRDISQKIKKDGLPYLDWEQQGWIFIHGSAHIDYGELVLQLYDDVEKYCGGLEQSAFDKHRFPDFEQEVDLQNKTPLDWVDHPQKGFVNLSDPKKLCMNRSIDTVEILFSEQRIRLEDSPVMRAAVLGCTIVVDRDDTRRFDKQESFARIDPMVALTQAVGVAQLSKRDTFFDEWSYEKYAEAMEDLIS